MSAAFKEEVKRLTNICIEKSIKVIESTPLSKNFIDLPQVVNDEGLYIWGNIMDDKLHFIGGYTNTESGERKKLTPAQKQFLTEYLSTIKYDVVIE